MKRRYRAGLFAALVAVCFIGSVKAQGPHQGAAAPEPCPDKAVSTGRYSNRRFGYAIVIPPGRKGVWNSGRCDADEKHGCICLGPDHGRAIPLAADAGIEVYAGYGREPNAALTDYESAAVLLIRERAGVEQAEVLSTAATRLGSLPARRFVVRIKTRQQTMIEDRVIAVHKDVEYNLTLSSPESRYQQNKREFERVITSWRLVARAR
jgi:hypothetical protein